MNKTCLQKHLAGHLSLLSQFHIKATYPPRYPCAFRGAGHLMLQGQISTIAMYQSAQFCSSPSSSKQTSYPKSIVSNSDFCSFHHYFILNSKEVQLPTPGHAEEHLDFRGTVGDATVPSQAPASPITHQSLHQQCRRREWVFPGD